MPEANESPGWPRLSSWMLRRVRSEHGIDLERDPASRARVEELAMRAVRRFQAAPGEEIRASLTWGPADSQTESTFVISPREMREILGWVAESPATPGGSADELIRTSVAAVPGTGPPTLFETPRPPTFPVSSEPATAQMPPLASGQRRGKYAWAIAVISVIAVGLAAALAYVLLSGGDDEESAGTPETTETPETPAPASATATRTATDSATSPPPTATSTRQPPTASPTPQMHPGREVTVVNTQPDPCLYLRPEPDRETTPLTCLLEGTQVRLVRGPQELDGVVWWFVQVPDYQGKAWEGYAAEKEAGSDTPWLVPR